MIYILKYINMQFETTLFLIIINNIDWEIKMEDKARIKKVLTVMVVRNGKVIEKVTPYTEAPIWGKILYWFGLKNYTREIR